MGVLGIDVGFTGALVFYDATRHHLTVSDMPLQEPSILGLALASKGYKTRSTKAQRKLCIPSLIEIIRSKADSTELVVVERVHSFTGQGVASTFRFGEQFGIIQGALAACGFGKDRVWFVEPAVWKAAVGVTSVKETSLRLARERFGTDFFKRLRDHGRAEAALLAWFGAQKLKTIDSVLPRGHRSETV